MNRKELISNIANIMRENDVRKPVHMPKQVFHISDDEGNTRDLVIRQTDKNVLFTAADVDAVLAACQHVIEEALKHGEEISIHNFGTLGLNLRAARTLKHVGTGEKTTVDAHYLPKFTSGKELRMCAKLYELSLKDKQAGEESDMNGA